MTPPQDAIGKFATTAGAPCQDSKDLAKVSRIEKFGLIQLKKIGDMHNIALHCRSHFPREKCTFDFLQLLRAIQPLGRKIKNQTSQHRDSQRKLRISSLFSHYEDE
jgi:hypothetical protein